MYGLYSSPNVIRVTVSREDEMSGTYGMYDKKEKCIQGFSGENLWKLPTWKTWT
jgi:hypothetical protein